MQIWLGSESTLERFLSTEKPYQGTNGLATNINALCTISSAVASQRWIPALAKDEENESDKEEKGEEFETETDDSFSAPDCNEGED